MIQVGRIHRTDGVDVNNNFPNFSGTVKGLSLYTDDILIIYPRILRIVFQNYLLITPHAVQIQFKGAVVVETDENKVQLN